MRLDIWNISGSGFHFGRHGLGQEESSIHWPSDSLFAAITARVAALQGASGVQTWMDHFLDDPPVLVLTSAFPRAGSVQFYPAPLRTRRQSGSEERVPHKTIKRLKFVSESVLHKLLDGALLAEQYDEKLTFQGGQVLVDQKDLPALPEDIRTRKLSVWKVEQQPRVALGRVQVNSNLYHTGRTVFSPQCGLWFGVQWLKTDDTVKAFLEEILNDLGYAGLGGERSSGFGSADLQPAGSIEFSDYPGQPWVSLSRYLPRNGESAALLDPLAAYNMENVGGWAQSASQKAERRRNVRMLVEGSVFGAVEGTPGRVVDVQPDYGGTQPLGHPVWRNGAAVAVGFKPGALEER